MKLFFLIIIFFLSFTWMSCNPTKKISKVIEPKDTVIIVTNEIASSDSILLLKNTLDNLSKNYIDFKTFSAKIKVDVEVSKGKVPDLIATIRIIKDSVIWISLSSVLLNIEAYRVYISRDSVIVMHKLDKEVQYRSLDYLQEVTQIPFDFKTLQDLFLGNPVFFNDSTASFRKMEDFVLASSLGENFKNLLTLSAGNNLLLHSKMDDVDIKRNRTASITYDDYTKTGEKFFSVKRQIIISEKSKIDIRLNFKQFEFNKELSVGFTVPKNYKKK